MRYTIEAAVLRDGLLKIESVEIEGPRGDEGLAVVIGGFRLILPMTFIVDSTPPSGVPYTLNADLRVEAAFANAAKGVFLHLRAGWRDNSELMEPKRR